MNCGSPWSWNSPSKPRCALICNKLAATTPGEVKVRKYHVEASASFQ
jgi:hypothetical protein